MDKSKEILLTKDDFEHWAFIDALIKRRAARGIKEPEGPPPFVQKMRKRLEERKAGQKQSQPLSRTFLAFFEPVDGRGFRAVCPTVENCAVEAPTREEAKAVLLKALEQRLRIKIKAGESVPTERGSAEMVEVALCEE